MMKVYVQNLGCKVNLYEAQAIKNSFELRGYDVKEDFNDIDVYVINTCTVTNKSDSKSRQMISKVKKKNPNAIVIICGCYSQINSKEIEEMDIADIIVGTQGRNKIVDYLEEYLNIGEKRNYVEDNIDKNYEELLFDKNFDSTRAFIKIEDGCNNFCSYCIIPYARGRVRSREISSIINEIKALVEDGYKEFVITGIQITDYEDEGTDLITLLEKIDKVDGLERIRLGSIQPKLLQDETVARLAKLEHLQHQFHLSLQSGSNKILKLMNRKYSKEDYINNTNKIYKAMPDASITTDIIVGFPCEDDEDFNESVDIVKKVNFLKVHVFRYSRRKGTRAYDMKCQVAESVKKERAETLEKYQEISRNIFINKFIGEEFEVLFEEHKNSYFEGYTSNYIRAYLKTDEDLHNKIVKVKAVDTFNDGILVERI